MYLVLVSKTKDIKRVFQYHGAEHKTIFCYESGAELTVENCRRQTRFHPRCGTSFLILTLLCDTTIGKQGMALVEQDTVLNFLYNQNIFVKVFMSVFYGN